MITAGFINGKSFRNGIPEKLSAISLLKEAYEAEKNLLESNEEIVEVSESGLSSSQPSGPSGTNESISSVTRKSSSQPSASKKSKADQIFTGIHDYHASQQSLNGDSNEVDSYLAEVKVTRDVHPLKYWKNSKDNYPILSSLASKILSMPATSASVERLFSVAGSIISQRRCNLKIGTAEQILFYKEYLRTGIKP